MARQQKIAAPLGGQWRRAVVGLPRAGAGSGHTIGRCRHGGCTIDIKISDFAILRAGSPKPMFSPPSYADKGRSLEHHRHIAIARAHVVDDSRRCFAFADVLQAQYQRRSVLPQPDGPTRTVKSPLRYLTNARTA